MNGEPTPVNLTVPRMTIVVRGAVQGVGFRPFVYKLAQELHLSGWVSNSMSGVEIEVEGPKEALDSFLVRLAKEKPSRSSLQSVEVSLLEPVGYQGFEIRASIARGSEIPLIMPDIATCPDCLREIFDIGNRRYLYPFTNCTHCGPRYSIIESLPYDRQGTSMKRFSMCPACRHEYSDPEDRRFHAQPNACPMCGPTLELLDRKGKPIKVRREALLQAARAIRDGQIVALKGLGGFQLLVDAGNDRSVKELRRRKHREEKPFAVMAPSLEVARSLCMISPLEERLLVSSEAPIVLLDRIFGSKSPAPSVAPGNPTLGIMLPYTPLHHILLRDLGIPVVATSGNLSDEPICTDEHEALDRLGGIADVFLVHDRPIVRHVDDSVARIMLGREMILRRARGYAPLPLTLSLGGQAVLAVGAHLKNTVAVSTGSETYISQHIGDLETHESFTAFQNTAHDLSSLLNATPEIIVCDNHPDYLSTKYARQAGKDVRSFQHHHTHIASCMAENRLEGQLLGVAWDGTGYGLDGTIWGGEFLVPSESSFDRMATFKSFRIPGGDQAMKEPRRAALGVLFELFGEAALEDHTLLPRDAFARAELPVLQEMLRKGINAPRTTSVGRLFDAVSSLVGLRHVMTFEGQAAMELEWAAQSAPPSDESYDFMISDLQTPLIVDWTPMIIEITKDAHTGVPRSLIASKFHNALCEIVLSVAQRIGQDRVVLSGGCFQNRYLLEHCSRLLGDSGFQVYGHQRVPPNDGGISLGQLYALRLSQGFRIGSTTQLTREVIL